MATKQQREAANAVFGEELTDQILGGGEERTKELEKAGVAHKGESEVVDEVETEEVQDAEPAEEDAPEGEEEKGADAPELDLKALAQEVASIFEVRLEPLAEMAAGQAELAAEIKSLKAELAALQQQESLKKEVEMPRFTLSLQTKRASTAEETEVPADDPLAKMKPAETKPNVSGAAHYFGS